MYTPPFCETLYIRSGATSCYKSPIISWMESIYVQLRYKYTFYWKILYARFSSYSQITSIITYTLFLYIALFFNWKATCTQSYIPLKTRFFQEYFIDIICYMGSMYPLTRYLASFYFWKKEKKKKSSHLPLIWSSLLLIFPNCSLNIKGRIIWLHSLSFHRRDEGERCAFWDGVTFELIEENSYYCFLISFTAAPVGWYGCCIVIRTCFPENG